MSFRRLNLILFCCVLLSIGIVSWLPESTFFSGFEKPWQLQPFANEDSLSTAYKKEYRILNKVPVLWQLNDTTGTIAIILIDAWGVPLDESRMAAEFSIFKDLPHDFALHQRLANRTEHAENVEWKGDFIKVACDSCSDAKKIVVLDSLISQKAGERFALIAQESRYGDMNALHNVLSSVATIAKKHPECKFIVQGTHRPILGAPEVRRLHKSHWVPVVLLNAKFD